MADIVKDQSEGIDFAFARGVFERQTENPVPKSPSESNTVSVFSSLRTHSSISSNEIEKNAVEDQSREVRVITNDHRPSVEGLPGLSSSASFIGSTEVPRANYVIPKKRGDTSDLRWLTAVHHSKPLGLRSSSETFNRKHSFQGNSKTIDQTDSCISHGNNQLSDGVIPHSISSDAHLSKAVSNHFREEFSSLSQVQVDSNTLLGSRHSARDEIPNIDAASLSIPVGRTIKDDDQAEVAMTPIVKSSVTVTLNTGNASSIKRNSSNPNSNPKEKGGHTARHQDVPRFSVVLEEMMLKKVTSVSESQKEEFIEDHVREQLVEDQKTEESKHASKPGQAVSHVLPVNMANEERVPDYHEEDGFRRVRLKDWNPNTLMQELCKITLQPEINVPVNYNNMEGYLEKLPISKAKDTFLKTWKRRYFRAFNGTLYYYDSTSGKKESGSFKLDGGNVEDIGDRMIGIEDGRGHYLVIRCASDQDCVEWMRALQSQVVEAAQSSWVKPILQSPKANCKKVILLELGSCSVRAGLLGETVSLPDVFIPTIVATNRTTGQQWFGFDALLPQVRALSTISYPVRPSHKVDKYSIDWNSMPGIFEHIFHCLNVDPSQYFIMFSIPTRFNDKIKSQFMDLFVNHFKVLAVNMVCQTVLSLYSYNVASGIVVDIGDRIEILPIADGYVVDGGVRRFPYGGQMITDTLNHSFTNQRYRFCTDVEFQIVRLSMEKLCYVSNNFGLELAQFQENPEKFCLQLSLDGYNLPTGSFDNISTDLGRFKSPEGLFDTSFWGLDNPPIHEMVKKAIQACPIDVRRLMWRSIYLSGGVTLLKGFPERLQMELSKLAPSAVVVQVHAAPNRYHSSYIGASTVALMPAFENGCVSSSEWSQNRSNALKKWKAA